MITFQRITLPSGVQITLREDSERKMREKTISIPDNTKDLSIVNQEQFILFGPDKI